MRDVGIGEEGAILQECLSRLALRWSRVRVGEETYEAVWDKDIRMNIHVVKLRNLLL